jgi:hypothetical protein
MDAKNHLIFNTVALPQAGEDISASLFALTA